MRGQVRAVSDGRGSYIADRCRRRQVCRQRYAVEMENELLRQIGDISRRLDQALATVILSEGDLRNERSSKQDSQHVMQVLLFPNLASFSPFLTPSTHVSVNFTPVAIKGRLDTIHPRNRFRDRFGASVTDRWRDGGHSRGELSKDLTQMVGYCASRAGLSRPPLVAASNAKRLCNFSPRPLLAPSSSTRS